MSEKAYTKNANITNVANIKFIHELSCFVLVKDAPWSAKSYLAIGSEKRC